MFKQLNDQIQKQFAILASQQQCWNKRVFLYVTRL